MSVCKWISRFKWPAEHPGFYPVAAACFQDTKTPRTLLLVAATEGIVSNSATDPENLTSPSEDAFPCTLVYGGSVKSLKVTESVVLVITQDDQLLVLDLSCDRFVPIGGYCYEGKIRHVEQGVPSNQLLVVRQTETGNRTVLDVLESDNSQPNSFRLLRTYDLALELVDAATRIIVKAVTVEPGNRRFFSDFLGFGQFVYGQCVLLASANNKLYWLQQQHDESNVDLNTVRCFASNVLDFEFSTTGPCCSLVVLLDAGVLTAFRNSFQSESESISSCCTSVSICLQSPPVETYAFDTLHNSLLYSNGFGMFRLWYNHEADTKENMTECEEIAVYGVAAIALIGQQQSKALLVTENNQLYLYEVTPWQRNASYDPARLVKLGKGTERSTRLLKRRMAEEMELDDRTEAAVKDERMKFNVLALYWNRREYGQLATMETTFHSVMPPARPSGTVMLSEASENDPVALFACVKLSINQECFELLVQQRRWSICLSYPRRTIVYPVHESFSKAGVFNAIIMLGKSQLDRGVPVIRAHISSAVQHGGDSALLTLTHQIPIGKCDITVDATAPFAIPEHTHQNLRTAAVEEIIRSNRECRRTEQLPILAKPRVAYSILNESSKETLLSIIGELTPNSARTWYTLDEPVNIDWPTVRDGPIRLSSYHPVALDLVKRLLLNADETGTEMALQRDKLKALFLELQAAQGDDLIRKLYHRVRNAGDELTDESSRSFAHLNLE